MAKRKAESSTRWVPEPSEVSPHNRTVGGDSSNGRGSASSEAPNQPKPIAQVATLVADVADAT